MSLLATRAPVRGASAIPGPETPYTSEGGEWSPTTPLDYGSPGGGLTFRPDDRVGADGTPTDWLGPTGDNPSLPPAWRRKDTSGQQVDGVGINLRDNGASTWDGWGRQRPPTEFLQDEGGLVTFFADQEGYGGTGTVRYPGSPNPSELTNWSYLAQAAPISGAEGEMPLATGITPFVTAIS